MLPEPRRTAARRWVIIGLLSLGMILAYLSRSNLAVALAVPDFITSFHLSDTDRGMLNSGKTGQTQFWRWQPRVISKTRLSPFR
jgi:hypothetical protein